MEQSEIEASYQLPESPLKNATARRIASEHGARESDCGAWRGNYDLAFWIETTKADAFVSALRAAGFNVNRYDA